jgi:hypothetical protein
MKYLIIAIAVAGAVWLMVETANVGCGFQMNSGVSNLELDQAIKNGGLTVVK